VRVAELPSADRPREKLVRLGPQALSDVELLAVLLRTGTVGAPVLDLAREWLDEIGGIDRLAGADLGTVLRRKGVGLAKGTVVAAALELGRRLARRRLEGRPILDRPELIADYLGPLFGGERVEVFGCVTLDARHHLGRVHVIHRGARTHADVEPAEIFNRAIAENAHSIVIWHTHPSGDPTPSADDLELTRRLAQGGRLLHIEVLDHIVLARGDYVSLRQRGALPPL
jgi:DNA repair protein RadC